MITRLTIIIVTLTTLAGCFSPGPRQPLFGRADDPPPPGEATGRPNAPQPALPHRETPATKLVQTLREGDDTDRRKVAEELVARGAAAREDVRAARDAERVLVEILESILRDIDEAPPLGEAPPQPFPPKAQQWVSDKHRLARDRYLVGDIYGALKLVDALLELQPSTPLLSKLLALRRHCHDRLLRDSVLVADVVTKSLTIGPKDELHATVLLKNISTEPLVLQIRDKTLLLGQIDIDYEEAFPDGTRTRLRSQRSVRYSKTELRLGPGQSTELSLTLPSPHRDLRAGMVGRYKLSGRLRAHTMLVGETSYAVFVPIFPIELVVLTPQDRPLAVNPRASYDAAVAAAGVGSLADRAEPARRVFVTSLLMARDDREGALETLTGTLANATGPLSQALCAGLARVTGEPLSFTREEWLAWWRNRTPRPTKAPGTPPPEDDSD